jgi:hypothetical protein
VLLTVVLAAQVSCLLSKYVLEAHSVATTTLKW